ncbi:MAG: metallophosphoesterase [Archaeoglobaceae archaeon]
MKILAVADLHSQFSNLKKILGNVDFDVLLIAGDITNFKDEDVFKVDELISGFVDRCYAIHGNCDSEKILSYELDSIEFIHKRSLKIEDFTLHGLGGSGITPFRTLSEYTDEQIENIILNFKLENSFDVLLSHCPPKGVLDLTNKGINAGCEAIRKHAKKFKLIICGHIHEAFGIYRGEYIAVNPGPAFSGRYALIETENLKVETFKI